MEKYEANHLKKVSTNKNKKKSKKKTKSNPLMKLIIVIIFLIAIIKVLDVVSNNYVTGEITNKINLVIGSNNVTCKLQNEIYIENDVIYMSFEDIKTFLDSNIYYDEQYNQIITGSTQKIAVLPIEKNEIKVNSAKKAIKLGLVKKENSYYIPISELEDVYHIQTKYVENTNIVIIDDLNKEYTIATLGKNVNVKYKTNTFSKTIAKVNKGEAVAVYENIGSFTKVRTESGILGYIKTGKMGKPNNLRQEIEKQEKIDGNISIKELDSLTESEINKLSKEQNVISTKIFSLDKSKIGNIKVTTKSLKDNVKKLHEKGYKVWAMLSDDNLFEVLKDYELREKLINQITDNIVQYNLDGINIELKNTKENLSRFLIELSPRLNEIGAVLCVKITDEYEKEELNKIVDYCY